MTVRELMAELSGMNPNAVVMMSRDGEGNQFRPLEGADDECYVGTDNTIVFESRDYFREVDMDPISYEGWEPCVVLWPTW